MPVPCTVLRLSGPAHVRDVVDAVNRACFPSTNVLLWLTDQAPDRTLTEAEAASPALQATLEEYVSNTAAGLSGHVPALTVIKRVVDSISDGSAGWAFRVANEKKKVYWVKDTLRDLLELYLPRAKDAYVVWLKPVQEAQRLTVFEYQNLPLSHDHYEFHLGEGLAGRVWQSGQGGAHAETHPHPWWVQRKAVEHITYVCVPVGAAGDADGILAVGSLSGFPLQPGDVDVVAAFAALLRLGACL